MPLPASFNVPQTPLSCVLVTMQQGQSHPSPPLPLGVEGCGEVLGAVGCTQRHMAGTPSTWSRRLAEHSGSVARTQQHPREKRRKGPRSAQELCEWAEGPGLAPRCAAATKGHSGRWERGSDVPAPL